MVRKWVQTAWIDYGRDAGVIGVMTADTGLSRQVFGYGRTVPEAVAATKAAADHADRVDAMLAWFEGVKGAAEPGPSLYEQLKTMQRVEALMPDPQRKGPSELYRQWCDMQKNPPAGWLIDDSRAQNSGWEVTLKRERDGKSVFSYMDTPEDAMRGAIKRALEEDAREAEPQWPEGWRLDAEWSDCPGGVRWCCRLERDGYFVTASSKVSKADARDIAAEMARRADARDRAEEPASPAGPVDGGEIGKLVEKYAAAKAMFRIAWREGAAADIQQYRAALMNSARSALHAALAAREREVARAAFTAGWQEPEQPMSLGLALATYLQTLSGTSAGEPTPKRDVLSECPWCTTLAGRKDPSRTCAKCSPGTSAGEAREATYQERVRDHFLYVAGDDLTDVPERRDRACEEFAELQQALGGTIEGWIAVGRYVWSRPVGEPAQEMGGTLNTLAALAAWAGLDMMRCAEVELERTKRPEIVAKIRRKRANRHGRGVLPGDDADLVTSTTSTGA